MEKLLIAQPVEPTQTFYAILAGTLAVLIAGMFGYMTRKLVVKIEEIVVVQNTHDKTLAVHHEKHTATEKDLDTHRAKLDRLERVSSNFKHELADEIIMKLKTIQQL